LIYAYIDTNVIIASEIRTERNHQESKEFMDRVLASKKREVSYVVSVFAFLELASAMIRRTGNPDKAYSLLYRIRTSWKKSLKPVLPLRSKELASFTNLMDTLIETAITLRTPTADTIHAQTIMRYDFDYLVTWNKRHFTGLSKAVKKLKIITPIEMLVELKRIGV